MKLWLTRCHGGRYILTLLKPEIAQIRGTHIMDAFERIGEPIAVKHLCAAGVKSLMGVELEELVPTKVEITARLAPDPRVPLGSQL